jgi:protein-L-isoaspartate(D-aspartate) O-methyltransferase
MNFDEARRLMVEEQLIPRGISNQLVLDAMRKVPRHKFVLKDLASAAYNDRALPIGEDQTISQPYMVAKMTELLGLKGGEKVLEVGSGSGYQAAVLAEVAGKVYSIEYSTILADRARKTLKEIGYNNIIIMSGDGTKGLEDKAQFNGIIVTAGAPAIPKPLMDQLADGGRLVIPVGDRHLQTLKIVTRTGNKMDISDSIDCVFVPLLGEFGWPK